MLGVCFCANSKSSHRRNITVVEMCELKAEDYVRSLFSQHYYDTHRSSWASRIFSLTNISRPSKREPSWLNHRVSQNNIRTCPWRTFMEKFVVWNSFSVCSRRKLKCQNHEHPASTHKILMYTALRGRKRKKVCLAGFAENLAALGL